MGPISLGQWKETTLKNYIAKHNPTVAEIEHVLDYLSKHPKERLTRASYPQILTKANRWVERLNKKNKDIKFSGNVSVVATFPNGFKIVRLLDQAAKDWEGVHMKHCVSSYKDHNGIYSLRNKDNFPFCTMEIFRGDICQVSGPHNGRVEESYLPMVFSFLKKFNNYEDYLYRYDYRSISKVLRKFLDSYFTGLEYLAGAKISESFLKINSSATLIKSLQKCPYSKGCNFALRYFYSPEVVLDLVNNPYIRIDAQFNHSINSTLESVYKYVLLTPREQKFLNKYFSGMKYLTFKRDVFLTNFKDVKLIKPFKENSEELFLFVLNHLGSDAAVQQFVDNGVDVTKNNSSCLRIAAKRHQNSTVDLLLKAGARIDEIDYLVLKHAAYAGNKELLATVLRAATLDLNITYELISYASAGNQQSCIKLICDKVKLTSDLKEEILAIAKKKSDRDLDKISIILDNMLKRNK